MYVSSKDAVVVQGATFPFPVELVRHSDQFLSTRHCVVRQFPKRIIARPPSEPTPLSRILYVSDPSGTLPYESVESVFFSEVLASSFDVEVHNTRKMTLSEFRSRLSTSEYDILHFTGHGQYKAASHESALVFADETLSAGAVRSIPIKHPPRLVVLNVCSTARGTSLSEADGGAVHSLAQAFLSKGSDAVVGTLWPISDCSAARFATSFYRFVFTNQVDVADALFLTKRRYLSSEETCDIAGYVLYSLPGAHIVTLRKEWAIDSGQRRHKRVQTGSREWSVNSWYIHAVQRRAILTVMQVPPELPHTTLSRTPKPSMNDGFQTVFRRFKALSSLLGLPVPL